jgi:hypothetical protein
MMNNEMESLNGDELSMSEILGNPLQELDPIERSEMERKKAERDRCYNERVVFRGVGRRRGEFCSFVDEGLRDAQLSWSGFTAEETERGEALCKPFNDRFCDDSENSQSMFARWMDKDGFIFAISDDLTDSTIITVHEKDLEAFSAKRCQ